MRVRRPFRLLRGALAALGVLVLLVIALVGGALWLTLPANNQQLRIAGLSGPVTIKFDADGIPRISAGNDTDAATAIGFVHARDRMFEMELMRRAASGRLSEIAGPATLGIDRMMRTLGLRRRAVEDYAAMPADTRGMLEAYARGVNSWIAERGRFAAPEFLLLGAPEPWTPVDSLLWGKTMALWLSENWRTELSRLALGGRVSQTVIDKLWPPAAGAGDPQARAVTGVEYADAAQRVLDALPRFPAPFTLPSTASNEWAVDGSHTATGAPLLAGDPHLAFGYPGIWYLARIDTPQGVLAGATAPGIPFMVLGHNSRIAWTFTSTGADTEDLFIETPAEDGKYLTPDGPQPFVLHEERIKVRGAPDVVLTVRETRHGPVISDVTGGVGKILAVAMAALQPGDTAAAGLYALNRAQDVTQAATAAAGITNPVQNLLVADPARIALYMTGRVPIRRSGDGSAPVMGADGAHDWVGFASGEQLPHYLAPASGRLVNANERPAPPEFPVFLGRDWFGTWRAQRIRELLARSDRQTPEDFSGMQLDVQSVFARQILPRLRSVTPPDGIAGRALALLRDWDGSMVMDQPQPLIFTAWVDQLYIALLRHANVPLADGGPRAEFVAWALSPDGAQWCGGDCLPIARAALDTAVADLVQHYGPDPAAWRWGVAHQAIFAHPLLRAIPLLARLGTLAIASPGGDTTLDRGGTTLENFNSVHGPEYRGVYDLADLNRSRFMMAPGQSGNLLSRHSGDFLLRWRDGATIALGPATSDTLSVIQLQP